MNVPFVDKPLLNVLNGHKQDRPPIWLMRQAGRYLPEYKATRAKAKDFIAFCYTPELAAEATLQPIRRYGFDGAIMFSDILVVPDALGQGVRFVEGEGPRLDAIATEADFDALKPEVSLERLGPVFEMIGRVKSELPRETTFLGFCGAPWTVASYMIAGKGTPDLAPSRLFAYRQPALFARLIERLVDASATYLTTQLSHGVDAVQIFESFAGALPPAHFEAWCVKPIREIINRVRAVHFDAKIIVFARGAGPRLAELAAGTGASAVGVDWSVDLSRLQLPIGLPRQGNLDPLALVAGGSALHSGIDQITQTWHDTPYVFNLGHGILPETPLEHVEDLVRRVRA